MKQLFLAAFILCVFVACNTATNSTNTKDTMAPADTTSINQTVTYAYPVEYSSDFTIGDTKYAQTVLELWKDFDNNTFDNNKDAFADSVTMDLSDGTEFMNSPKDSMLKSVKAYRSSFKNVVSSVEAITTLKTKGKDESWVCVWGKEIDTYNNNKVDSIYYHETWEFNKDGKIVYMDQYQATPPKAPAKK